MAAKKPSKSVDSALKDLKRIPRKGIQREGRAETLGGLNAKRSPYDNAPIAGDTVSGQGLEYNRLWEENLALKIQQETAGSLKHHAEMVDAKISSLFLRINWASGIIIAVLIAAIPALLSYFGSKFDSITSKFETISSRLTWLEVWSAAHDKAGASEALDPHSGVSRQTSTASNDTSRIVDARKITVPDGQR